MQPPPEQTHQDHPPIQTQPQPKAATIPSDIEYTLWYTTAITASIILITISIALIVLYFKKSCKMPSHKSGKIFTALLIICLIFWMVEASLTLHNIIIPWEPLILAILPKIFYNISRAIMLFYFIIKSHVVFHDSAYSVSKTFIWILFALTLVAFFLQVFPLIYDVIKDERSRTTVYLLCCGWSIDFIVSIAAMYKFISILFKLSLSTIEYNNKESKIRLTKVQLKMMKTITKTTVLSVFALLSSVIFGFFFNPYPVINPTVAGNDIIVSALSDSALNAICMYLSYGFTTKQYECCCKYCDIGIGNLCLWCTKKAIQRKAGDDVVKEVTVDNNYGVSRTNAIDAQDQSRLALPSKSSKTQETLESTSTVGVEENMELSARK